MNFHRPSDVSILRAAVEAAGEIAAELGPLLPAGGLDFGERLRLRWGAMEEDGTDVWISAESSSGIHRGGELEIFARTALRKALRRWPEAAPDFLHKAEMDVRAGLATVRAQARDRRGIPRAESLLGSWCALGASFERTDAPGAAALLSSCGELLSDGGRTLLLRPAGILNLSAQERLDEACAREAVRAAGGGSALDAAFERAAEDGTGIEADRTAGISALLRTTRLRGDGRIEAVSSDDGGGRGT